MQFLPKNEETLSLIKEDLEPEAVADESVETDALGLAKIDKKSASEAPSRKLSLQHTVKVKVRSSIGE